MGSPPAPDPNLNVNARPASLAQYRGFRKCDSSPERSKCRPRIQRTSSDPSPDRPPPAIFPAIAGPEPGLQDEAIGHRELESSESAVEMQVLGRVVDVLLIHHLIEALRELHGHPAGPAVRRERKRKKLGTYDTGFESEPSRTGCRQDAGWHVEVCQYRALAGAVPGHLQEHPRLADVDGLPLQFPQRAGPQSPEEHRDRKSGRPALATALLNGAGQDHLGLPFRVASIRFYWTVADMLTALCPQRRTLRVGEDPGNPE